MELTGLEKQTVTALSKAELAFRLSAAIQAVSPQQS
jgi:hypothetical protein